MKWVRKYLNLPSTDRHLLIKAALLLGAIRLGLWILPFRVLWRFLGRHKHRPAEPRETTPSIPMDRLIWGVKVASRYVPAATCLAQALATRTLLSRNGYPADLQIGVVKTERGELEAHAWVESNGRIVIGNLPDLARYNALPALRARDF
jgi:hypothetical protein